MNKIQILNERAAITQAIRSFFIEHDFLEVETPIRIPALAPEAYIIPQESEGWYLQTSPELCMKRLLAAGCDKIFQICKCFRKYERGRRHLPEMTMLEWYRPGGYQELMEDCQSLLASITTNKELIFNGHRVNLDPPWQRLSVSNAFQQYSPISLDMAMANNRFEEIMVEEIEPHLGLKAPCFLIDYPTSLASLARLHPDNPQLAERFELYIAGFEIANGFSELNEPAEQRKRFIDEQQLIKEQGRSPGPMPEHFLTELDQIGITAGIALGMDRLIMLLTSQTNIDHVVAFTPEQL